MSIEKIDTLVVGAGQAGIAMSVHLSNNNVSHIVLERHHIAERWRSERWDSLVANGPAWHDKRPSMTFSWKLPETAGTNHDSPCFTTDKTAALGSSGIPWLV